MELVNNRRLAPVKTKKQQSRAKHNGHANTGFLKTSTNSSASLYLSKGSVEADLEIVAVINSNTTKKAEALNHLVEGLDSGTVKGLNVSGIRVLGKQAAEGVVFLPVKILFS